MSIDSPSQTYTDPQAFIAACLERKIDDVIIAYRQEWGPEDQADIEYGPIKQCRLLSLSTALSLLAILNKRLLRMPKNSLAMPSKRIVARAIWLNSINNSSTINLNEDHPFAGAIGTLTWYAPISFKPLRSLPRIS